MIRSLGRLALVLVASPAAAQNADTVYVGVLRADGIAVPYAAYADGRWSWLPRGEIPLAIDRRSGEPWFLVRPHRPPTRVRGGSIVRFTGGDTMYEEWGVVTDYVPRELGDGMFPAGRVGVILSQPLAAVAFAPVERSSSLAERHLAFLRPHFDRAEAGALAREELEDRDRRIRLGHPTSADARRGETLRLLELRRSTDTVGKGYLSYAVIRRVYPAAPAANAACEAISEYGAWVDERNGDLSVVDDALTLERCTEMQLSVAQPHAALVLGERTFVLAEYSEYEGTRHAILEFDQGQLVAALPGRW